MTLWQSKGKHVALERIKLTPYQLSQLGSTLLLGHLRSQGMA